MNPYELLGILPTASTDEIKAAYRKRAQATHPDRFTGPERVAAEESYRLLEAAFKSLTQPAPEASIQLDTPARVVPSRSPEEAFQEAKAAFEAHHYETCANLARTAIGLDDAKAAYHCLLAAALQASGGDARELTAALENAIRLNPRDAESVALLGQTYQDLGMHVKASRVWGMLGKIAPDHPLLAPPAKDAGEPLRELGDRVQNLFEGVRGAAGRIFFKK